MTRRQTIIPDPPSLVRRVLIVAVLGVFGLGLLTIAFLDAREFLRGWGTDRVEFGAAMFTEPWLAAVLAMVAALVIRTPADNEVVTRRLGQGFLISGVLAIISLPGAYMAGAMIDGRLQALGYRQCANPSPGLRWRWDEWVRNDAACERNRRVSNDSGSSRGSFHSA